MNFGIPLWAKALILVALLGASFTAGVTWQAGRTTAQILDAAQKEREALAEAITGKVKEMSDAAVRLALTRSEREKALADELKTVQEEAEANASNSEGLPARAPANLNRLRRAPDAGNAGNSTVRPAR